MEILVRFGRHGGRSMKTPICYGDARYGKEGGKNY